MLFGRCITATITQFKPSARLEKPYAMMVCINIIAADSNRDAEFLFYLYAAGFCEATPWGNRPTAAAD